MDDNKKKLIDECRRVEENSLYTAASHFKAASLAKFGQYFLGAIPIILGGIGGWQYLSDPKLAAPENVFWAGLLTILAGISGSLLSFLNLSKVHIEHGKAGNEFKICENDARRAHKIYSGDEEYETFKQRVERIAGKYDELIESHTLPSDFCYWLAKRAIKRGEYKTRADEDDPAS